MLSFQIRITIYLSYLPEFGDKGYILQFNDTKTYHVSLYSSMLGGTLNFTVISVPRYSRPGVTSAIPGYPLFWLWSMLMIVVLISCQLYRKAHQKQT